MSTESKPTQKPATFSHSDFMTEVVTAGVSIEQLTSRQDAPAEQQTDLLTLAQMTKKNESYEEDNPVVNEALTVLNEIDKLITQRPLDKSVLVEIKLGRYDKAISSISSNSYEENRELCIARINDGESPETVIESIRPKNNSQLADNILLYAAIQGDPDSISRIERGDVEFTSSAGEIKARLLISQGRYDEALDLVRQRKYGGIESVENLILIDRLEKGDPAALEDILGTCSGGNHIENRSGKFNTFMDAFEVVATENVKSALQLVEGIEKHTDQFGLVTAVKGKMVLACARNNMVNEADLFQQQFLEAAPDWTRGHAKGYLSTLMEIGVARGDISLIERAGKQLESVKDEEYADDYRLNLYPKLVKAYLQAGDEAQAWAVTDNLTTEQGFLWPERTASLQAMARYFVDQGRLADAKRVAESIPLDQPGGLTSSGAVTTTYRRKEVLLAIADELANQARAARK